MLTAVMIGSAAYAADTATDDPAAQAATYEKQAVDLRATAAKHDAMASMHHAGAGSSKVNHESIERHCKEIAKNLRAAANESDALATDLRNSTKK
jgi:hypothetical protein